MYEFYQTAIAVRDGLDPSEPIYRLKKFLLKQIVAEYFANGEKELTYAEIQYNLLDFSSYPVPFVIEIVEQFLHDLSLDHLELKETKGLCSHQKTFIFG